MKLVTSQTAFHLTCVDEIVVMIQALRIILSIYANLWAAKCILLPGLAFISAKRKLRKQPIKWLDSIYRCRWSVESGFMRRDWEHETIWINPYAYRIKRLSYYLGQPIHFCGWRKDQPLRLFNRLKGTFNEAPVHESVISSAPKQTCKYLMHHYTYPTLESHFCKDETLCGAQCRQNPK